MVYNSGMDTDGRELKDMKRILIILLLLGLLLSVSAAAEEQPEAMRIHVTDGTNEVVFQLNDSSAAQSLCEQLPLELDVENYGSNEKIFYPPEQLNTENVIEGEGEKGTLAYFSPWGDVVMYYDSFDAYPGLYILGEAVQGADNIELLSGTITITAE